MSVIDYSILPDMPYYQIVSNLKVITGGFFGGGSSNDNVKGKNNPCLLEDHKDEDSKRTRSKKRM